MSSIHTSEKPIHKMSTILLLLVVIVVVGLPSNSCPCSLPSPRRDPPRNRPGSSGCCYSSPGNYCRSSGPSDRTGCCCDRRRDRASCCRCCCRGTSGWLSRCGCCCSCARSPTRWSRTHTRRCRPRTGGIFCCHRYRLMPMVNAVGER